VETSDEANDRSQSAEQKRSRRSKGDSKEAELRLICSQVARRRRRVRANYLTYSPCCCYETLNKVKYKKKKTENGKEKPTSKDSAGMTSGRACPGQSEVKAADTLSRTVSF
jgi:hypothetical protein